MSWPINSCRERHPTALRLRRGYLAGILFLAAAGVTPSAGADAVDDLQPGEWLEVPSSRLEDVWNGNPPSSLGGIMRGFSGGTFDIRNNRLLIWGGGHTNYSGNEIYAFDVDTLSWSLITQPSVPATNGETCPDGLPSSRHTYDTLVYLPSADALWASNGSLWQNGDCTNATWSYSLGLSPSPSGWIRRATSPGDPKCGAASGHDSTTGLIWFSGKGGLASYDIASDKWMVRNDEPNSPLNVTGAVDPVRRVFVMIGSGNAFIHDLTASGTIARQNLNSTGANSIENEGGPGLAYDSVSGRLAAWSGGADVYTLDTATRVWQLHPPAASNSVIPTQVSAGGGTFGRFQYVPAKNAFIAVNATDENVYFYKLSPGAGSVPDAGPLIDAGGGTGGSGGGGSGGGSGNAGGGGAGVGGSAGSASAGTGGNAGAPAGTASNEGSDSSCGCALPPSHQSRWLATLAPLAWFGWSRRSRRRKAHSALPNTSPHSRW